MKLNDYMPLFLSNIRELKQIFNTEDIELENIFILLNKPLQELIVRTADSYGLERYERIYNIKNTLEDIEARRLVILSKILLKPPFTMNWLIKYLNQLVGENGYILRTYFNNYIFKVEINKEFRETAKIIEQNIINNLPCNLITDVLLFQMEKAKVNLGGLVKKIRKIKLVGGVDT